MSLRILISSYDLLDTASGSGRTLNFIAEILSSFDCDVKVTSYNLDEATVRTFFNGKGPELILSQQWASYHWSMISLRLGVPFILLVHGPGQYEQFYVERWFPVKPILIIAPSCDTQDQLIEDARRQCVVINPPIDRKKVCYQYNTNELPEREYYTLIGNDFFAKGGKLFIELARRYPKRKFLVVSDKIEVDELPENIRTQKPTKEIWKVYHKTRLLLHPTNFESFGRVTKEAQLNNIPVVTTDLPGIREATINAAYYVDVNNINAWCDAIEQIEHNYELELERLKVAISSYGSDIEEVKSVYKKILNQVDAYILPRFTSIELDIFDAITLLAQDFRQEDGIDQLTRIFENEKYNELPIETRYRLCIEAAFLLTIQGNPDMALNIAQRGIMLDQHRCLEAASFVISHLMNQGKYREAYELGLEYLDICKCAVPIDPKFAERVKYIFYKDLASCAVKVNNIMLARRLIQECLNNELAQQQVDQLHRQLSEISEYEKMADTKSKVMSKNEMFEIANSLLDNKMFEEAIGFLSEHIEIEDNLSRKLQLCCKLSFCYRQLEMKEDAFYWLLRSFQYGIPTAEICYHFGCFFQDVKQFEIAIYWFENAVKNKVEDPNSYNTWLPHLQLTVCYDRIGNTAWACKHNELAAQFVPEHPSIQYNRKYFQELNSSQRKGV